VQTPCLSLLLQPCDIPFNIILYNSIRYGVTKQSVKCCRKQQIEWPSWKALSMILS
jgi:hypothetical protein